MNDNLLPSGSPLAPGWFDFFIVLGAILLVALAVLIWAIMFHKRGATSSHHHRHPHRPHHRRRHGSFRDDFQKTTAGIKEIIEKGKRQHHHRHEHRPMNPTLAQTGGLPPIREESKPPPPP
jgi:ABC-type nickel/cobalt efflux system permease component RcnA